MIQIAQSLLGQEFPTFSTSQTLKQLDPSQLGKKIG